MKAEEFRFTYQVFDSINELKEEDATLLRKAIEATKYAYAPYSNFHVGAVARLATGEYVQGTNQENASYPVGICAERVLLSAASSLYPQAVIESIAISYNANSIKSDHPIAPCGICRQSLQEYETRMNHPIRLILGGIEGKVFVIPDVKYLLPFSFTGDELNVKAG